MGETRGTSGGWHEDSAPSSGESGCPGGQPRLDIATLVREHHAELYRYAYRLTGTVADAEDLVQQTFLIAQQRLDQVRSAERVRAWLYTILRHCFLKDRRKVVPHCASALDLNIDEFASGEAEVAEVDEQQLQEALGALPEDARLIVTMFYFEDASYKEIAEKLDLKLGTVMSRLARAKEKLRQRLFRRSSARR